MPSLHNLVNPPDRTGRGSHPSIWRGVVVNITANSVWVRVPTLAQDDLTATNTVPGDIAPGDRVIIAAVEGRVENLVIVAKENPTVPNHVHLDTHIQYTGWGPLTLAANWTAGAEAGFYPGLRYRTDSRFLYIHGHVTGTVAGTITTLPVAPIFSSRLVAVTNTGARQPLLLTTTGALSSTVTGTLHLDVLAPLT